MGSSQSDIDDIDNLRRKYGALKQAEQELSERLDRLDIDRASIDQHFQKQCSDIKNVIDDVKKELRQAKQDYNIQKQNIDEEQTELRHRLQEMRESLCEVKIGEMRHRHSSIIKHRC